MPSLKFIARAACLTALTLLPVSQAQAIQELMLGAGWFDISRPYADSAELTAEWRGNPFYYSFQPMAGGYVNTDGAIYGYGGIDYDWNFLPKWYLTPSFAVGAYSRGDSAHLGGWIEFHSALGLDYELDSGYRVGAQISHVSNASIYDHNPGEESLIATFTIPFGN